MGRRARFVTIERARTVLGLGHMGLPSGRAHTVPTIGTGTDKNMSNILNRPWFVLGVGALVVGGVVLSQTIRPGQTLLAET